MQSALSEILSHAKNHVLERTESCAANGNVLPQLTVGFALFSSSYREIPIAIALLNSLLFCRDIQVHLAEVKV